MGQKISTRIHLHLLKGSQFQNSVPIAEFHDKGIFSKHISSVKVVCCTKLEKNELYSNEKTKKIKALFTH